MATEDRLPTGDGDQETLYWTYSGGSSRWDSVDDPVGVPDDDTTRLIRGSAGLRYCLFTFPAFAIPAGSTIEKLSIFIRHRTVGSSNLGSNRSALKVNGTRYLTTQDAIEVGNTYQENTQDWTTNPNTGFAWTVDDINGSGSSPLQQFGVYGSAGSSGEDLYVTQINATVTSTLAGQTYERTVSISAVSVIDEGALGDFGGAVALVSSPILSDAGSEEFERNFIVSAVTDALMAAGFSVDRAVILATSVEMSQILDLIRSGTISLEDIADLSISNIADIVGNISIDAASTITLSAVTPGDRAMILSAIVNLINSAILNSQREIDISGLVDATVFATGDFSVLTPVNSTAVIDTASNLVYSILVALSTVSEISFSANITVIGRITNVRPDSVGVLIGYAVTPQTIYVKSQFRQ